MVEKKEIDGRVRIEEGGNGRERGRIGSEGALKDEGMRPS